MTQNKIIGDASRSQRDKDQARRLRREAEAQLDLLISKAEGVTFSDFYSYCYFASEGFLPGYSFPRLPISAFVPGSGRRHAPRAREDCEAACYDCLMRYTNQMDHPILDRQNIRNLLSQLTGATVEASPTLGTRSKHLQRLFAEAGTRPDFFYDGDYGAAIYIDGPHHDYPERQNRDAAKTEAMEDLGYMVIRFGHQDDWNEMINQYPYIFGSEV